MSATDRRLDPDLVEAIAARVAELLGAPGQGEGSELIDAEEVARILGVRVDYVWALCRADQIPHQCFGRVKRFRREAIERWMDRRERGGDAVPLDEASPGPAARSRRRGNHPSRGRDTNAA
jgi:excisionase family DNA binding protein